MSRYARFKPVHGGFVDGVTVPQSERYNALLPGFKAWFSALNGFGDYLRSFFGSYGGYFDCYSEEHALVYTNLHKEFTGHLEEAIDSWLKVHDLGEEDFGEMLRQASLRGDAEGDFVVGTLLGLLDYEPWIGSIFALKRMALTGEGLPPDEHTVMAAPAAPPPDDDPGAGAAEPATMTVLVPEGVAPGQQVQVTSPDGQLLVVAVPEGCTPGVAFNVAYSAL